MRSLIMGNYTLSAGFSPSGSKRIMSDMKMDLHNVDSFLYKSEKLKLLEAMENDTVLLPLDQPAEACTAQFYADTLRDQLVVLACRLPSGDTVPVALGVFAGDEVYGNTLDPQHRFRGRVDTLSHLACVDANRLLAPVHLLTSLLRKGEFVTFDILAGGRLDLSPPSTDARLPAPLQLLVAGVQAALASQEAGQQQTVAGVVRVALERATGRRLYNSGPQGDRISLVRQVLAALTGKLALAPGQRRVTLPDTKAKLKGGKASKARNKAAAAGPPAFLVAAAERQTAYLNDTDILSSLYNMLH